jgi:hypothetical protein
VWNLGTRSVLTLPLSSPVLYLEIPLEVLAFWCGNKFTSCINFDGEFMDATRDAEGLLVIAGNDRDSRKKHVIRVASCQRFGDHYRSCLQRKLV